MFKKIIFIFLLLLSLHTIAQQITSSLTQITTDLPLTQSKKSIKWIDISINNFLSEGTNSKNCKTHTEYMIIGNTMLELTVDCNGKIIDVMVAGPADGGGASTGGNGNNLSIMSPGCVHLSKDCGYYFTTRNVTDSTVATGAFCVSVNGCAVVVLSSSSSGSNTGNLQNNPSNYFNNNLPIPNNPPNNLLNSNNWAGPQNIVGGSSNGGSIRKLMQPEMDLKEDNIIDSNGFYFSRVLRLQKEIEKNPDFLMPCDSLTLMPLDSASGYGTMFKRITNYDIPIEVKNIIDSLNNTSNVLTAIQMGYPKFEIQDLNSGTSASPRVNCDYFPVRIKNLPPGQTIYSILEYFKNNINDFIKDTPEVKFKPYNYFGVDFSSHFYRPTKASIGSIVSISDNMFTLLPIVKASVVVSDYFIDTLSKITRFKFTTITSPFDGKHPVSGNREFGIFQDPNNPSEYCFYISGVDRITDFYGEIPNFFGYGYERADVLWTRIQKRFIDIIKFSGGDALFYTPKNLKARPRWDAVKDYLQKIISFDQLKISLGC